MQYSHTMEYYSSMKRNGALVHAIKWMHLENVTLKGKKLDTKSHKKITKSDSIYMQCLEQAKP